ncbi:MAG: hypothetical protein ACYCVL_04520 [Gemmatimonadaceae bacterium]
MTTPERAGQSLSVAGARRLLLLAIIAALAVAAFLLDVPVAAIAVGVGIAGGALFAYRSRRLRQSKARATDHSTP